MTGHSLLFSAWGSFATLDSTYGKNWMQFPIQVFVGISSENCIIPFGVGAMRSECKGDYRWLIEQFHECHRNLPPTMITDGDTNISEAISEFASSIGAIVAQSVCSAWSASRTVAIA